MHFIPSMSQLIRSTSIGNLLWVNQTTFFYFLWVSLRLSIWIQSSPVIWPVKMSQIHNKIHSISVFEIKYTNSLLCLFYSICLFQIINKMIKIVQFYDLKPRKKFLMWKRLVWDIPRWDWYPCGSDRMAMYFQISAAVLSICCWPSRELYLSMDRNGLDLSLSVLHELSNRVDRI